MDWNLSKLFPTTVAALVAFTSFMNAVDDTQMRNLENRVSALEQRKGSNGMINPPARPFVKDGVDLYLQGSVFVWQANQSGLDYALTWNNSSTATPPANNDGGSGRFRHPNFKWDWGFKVAAGYTAPHDGWDLFLQWTRYHPERANSGTSVTSFGPGATVPPSVVYPLLLPANLEPVNPIGPGYAASMGWKLRLDLLDLELGREFFVSKWLTLRPHAGLRSAWLHQKSKVTYTGNPISTTAAANFSANLKNNFWGMGLRTGLDGEWRLGGGWSLFSDVAVSLLLGHFNISESESPTVTSGGVATTGVSQSFSEKFRATRLAADLSMGLRYAQTFACDRFGLMVQLGWEQHLFANQNQLEKLAAVGFANSAGGTSGPNSFSLTSVTNQGDLSTQGVTLTVEFDF